MTLGELMREKRTSLNLTKEDAAEAIDVSVKTIENWENGSHPPNHDKFALIMDAYQINQDDFMTAYMESIGADSTKKSTDLAKMRRKFYPQDPDEMEPLDSSDFADYFPTEYFSDRMLKMLRPLKFSVEEVELWRLLNIYADEDWNFSECWESHDDSNDTYGTPMELIKYLPKDYVIKTGVGNIFDMIYDIQEKLPNPNVEHVLDKLICPGFQDSGLMEILYVRSDSYEAFKSYSDKGFDINNVVPIGLLIGEMSLAMCSPIQYHDGWKPGDIYNRTTDEFPYLLALIASGNNVVFEKDLTRKYEGYEYFNSEWWNGIIAHMKACVKYDKYSSDLYKPDEWRNSRKEINDFYDNLHRSLIDESEYVDFWTQVVGKDQIVGPPGCSMCDDYNWPDTTEPILSPFPDWIEFHYEKTDDKLICTASLTKKGIQLCVDCYGWEMFINENTLNNIDISDDQTVPVNIYNSFINILWNYFDRYIDWQENGKTNKDCYQYIEESQNELMLHGEKLKSLGDDATHDMTFKDLKVIMNESLYWTQMIYNLHHKINNQPLEQVDACVKPRRALLDYYGDM